MAHPIDVLLTVRDPDARRLAHLELGRLAQARGDRESAARHLHEAARLAGATEVRPSATALGKRRSRLGGLLGRR